MLDKKQINKTLSEKYFKCIRHQNLAPLYSENSFLSGLFLPKASESYLKSNKKIMIVGKETRSWMNKDCRIKNNEGYVNIDAILRSMDMHEKYIEKPVKKSKFMQFYKELSQIVSSDLSPRIFWSNLFCVSYKSGSPVNSKFFHDIMALSKTLLRTQIEVLSPDAIFFVTGYHYDKYIKEFFPEYTSSKVIERKCLWNFKINKINCVRTSHPQWGKGRTWRKKGIDILQLTNT